MIVFSLSAPYMHLFPFLFYLLPELFLPILFCFFIFLHLSSSFTLSQANGIDFSSSIFGELVGVDNCGAGKVQGVTCKFAAFSFDVTRHGSEYLLKRKELTILDWARTGEITDNQIWDTKGNVVGSSSGGNSNNAPAPSKSSSQWQPEPTPAEEEEKWVEPSSSKWVEPSSSKWVEPSSSKWVEPSSSKWVEPSSSKWVEPSSSSKWVEPSPSPNRQALKAVPSDNDSNSNNIASVRLPILAAAKAVEPSSSSSWAAEHVVKPASKKEEEEKKSEVTFDKSAVSKASLKSDSTSSSNSEKCNEQQGQWRCQGKALEQCVQTSESKVLLKRPPRLDFGNKQLMTSSTAGDWTWSKRVECSVELINCDTANPVCPSKAACPVRKQVKL